MRWILGLLLVVVAGACIETGSYQIDVINKSDVCRPGYTSQCVDARTEGVFRGECDTSKSGVTIQVTVGRRRQIYERTALCSQWDDAALIVEERDGEIMATDTLLNIR